MNKRKLTALFITLLIFSVSGLSLSARHYRSIPFQFTSQKDTLYGVMNIPSLRSLDKGKMPLAIFVHGDGPLNQSAYGYYKPLWEQLAKEGIASLAWEKKGVGKSTGNWLDQSMADRAREVMDAIQSARPHQSGPIGLIGFSQAGWVLPQVAALMDGTEHPDFMIFISCAINWKQQSAYMTRKRLERSGASAETIRRALVKDQEEYQWFESDKTYEQFSAHRKEACEKEGENQCKIMVRGRFRFIQKNISADATEDLKHIKCPISGLFGTEDLNVDYMETYRTYQEIFGIPTKNGSRLKVYTGATHSLLKSKYFNTPYPGIGFLLKFSLFGKNAFVDGVLNDISSFIKEIK